MHIFSFNIFPMDHVTGCSRRLPTYFTLGACVAGNTLASIRQEVINTTGVVLTRRTRAFVFVCVTMEFTLPWFSKVPGASHTHARTHAYHITLNCSLSIFSFALSFYQPGCRQNNKPRICIWMNVTVKLVYRKRSTVVWTIDSVIYFDGTFIRWNWLKFELLS